jgi:predicted aspartyl protease
MTKHQHDPVCLSEDGWTKLIVVMPVEELRRVGPTLDIGMWPAGEPDSAIPLAALVDTGAGHSCISAAAARRLGVGPSGDLRLHAANSEPRSVPRFRCGFLLPGVRGEAEFAVLSTLRHPHDALIGRDIMASGRLVVDFTTGVWQLHWRSRGTGSADAE